MDSNQHSGVRLWSVPRRTIIAIVLAVFWLPFYEAIVHGQITPIITGILALAIGRGPFIRGFLVGLTAALKSPFAIMIPFVSISFGWRALLGCIVGASFALIHPSLFLEYLNLLANLAERPYGDIGLARWLGLDVCLPLTVVICLIVSIRWRGTENSFMAIIACVVIGTALWFHSYTPLILPVIYFANKTADRFWPVDSKR